MLGLHYAAAHRPGDDQRVRVRVRSRVRVGVRVRVRVGVRIMVRVRVRARLLADETGRRVQPPQVQQ